MPSKRKLASYLGISQNTIQTAYDQLCAEGYFERHIHKMRTLYRKKHAILFSAIDKYMKEKVEIIGEK